MFHCARDDGHGGWWDSGGYNDMSWFEWIGIIVVITGIAAVTGIKPKGTRHIAHTSLMWAARLALVVTIIIGGYLAFRAQSGG